MSADKIILNRAVRNVEASPAYQPISKVRVIVGQDADGRTVYYEAGSSSGRTLEIENPWGTQEIANNILSALQGYAYKPYQADGAILDPAAEIGDAVSVADVYSVIAEAETTFSPIMSANIGAREDSSIDHEYPFEDPQDREIARAIAKTRTSLTVELGRIAAEVAEIGNPDVAGSLANKIATLEITAETISATLESEYLTSGEVTTAINTAVTLAEGRIESSVSATYETKTEAASQLAEAKGYTNTREAAIRAQFESSLVQTESRIEATVAATIDRYDLSGLPSGSVVIKGYGEVTNSAYPPAANNGKYYVDLETGRCWKCNGSRWVLQAGTLQTTTDYLDSKITQTNQQIQSTVAATNAEFDNVYSVITQTADQLRAEISGGTAAEWAAGIGYYQGDIVKITTTDAQGAVLGVTYYQCLANHISSNATIPGVGSSWRNFWQVTNAPTVQSLIDASLDGIRLGYSSSMMPNSAVIELNRNGVTIDAATITMSNVQADTIAAGAYIQAPLIYDSNNSVALTMDGSYPGPGMALSVTSGSSLYQFLKILRSSNNTWFVFDGSLALEYQGSAGKVACYGTWDFSSANVILPS